MKSFLNGQNPYNLTDFVIFGSPYSLQKGILSDYNAVYNYITKKQACQGVFEKIFKNIWKNVIFLKKTQKITDFNTKSMILTEIDEEGVFFQILIYRGREGRDFHLFREKGGAKKLPRKLVGNVAVSF